MAGKGRNFTFHGAFKTKRSAVKKERSVGGFIVKRSNRFYVLKPKKRSK